MHSPVPTETESKGPPSFRDLKAVTPPPPASSLFARDQKRENQRENVVEGLLGSGSARRRNDSTQSHVNVRPAPALQKASGWGSWGSSLLTNVASSVAAPDRSPSSPEPPPVKPKIEIPPRGFTPSHPPKSQPAGFGLANKPTWGAGDNNTWGSAKTGPTPIAHKTSTGPAWGAKPTTTKPPLESNPNTAWPENIPEPAVEIRQVPAPGRFGAIISKVASPVQEKAPEPQTEVAWEPAKMEELATPAEEDEFDWANTPKKKNRKKKNIYSVTHTPSVLNTPEL